METSFRKIDIDLYDEDVLDETELYDADPRDPAQVLNDVKQRGTAVRSALSKCVSVDLPQYDRELEEFVIEEILRVLWISCYKIHHMDLTLTTPRCAYHVYSAHRSDTLVELESPNSGLDPQQHQSC